VTHDERAERIKKESIREARDPRTRKMLLGLAVLMLVLLAVTAVAAIVGYKAITNDAENSKQAAGVAVGTADTNKAAAEDLCAQIEALGKRCTTDPSQLDTGSQAVEKVVGKQGVQGIQGIQGIQGEPGETPSDEAVRAIIQRVLALDPPSDGQDGEDGQDGATGAQGVAGQTGPKGDTGAKGAQGDRGAQGETGPQGEQGPAGKGIAGLSCESLTTTQLTVTYTDGTTANVACGGGAVAPDPEPAS
jgi:hypothetical protein